jgi:hypothetical protein
VQLITNTFTLSRSAQGIFETSVSNSKNKPLLSGDRLVHQMTENIFLLINYIWEYRGTEINNASNVELIINEVITTFKK